MPTAQSLYEQGCQIQENGDDEKALEFYQEALEIDDMHAPSYAGIARTLIKNNDILNGVGFWGLAVKADPANAEYAESFLSFFKSFEMSTFNPDLKEVLSLCLAHDDIDTGEISKAWYSLFKHDPAFSEMIGAACDKDESALTGLLRDEKNFSALYDPFFIKALERFIVFNTDFEFFLTSLRRFLILNKPDSTLAHALALYCYKTEFIFACSPEEVHKLGELEESLDKAGGNDTPVCLLLLACYKNLSKFKSVPDLKDHLPENLYLLHIHLPQALAGEKDSIKALTPIKDHVSGEVRAQYESFPYPQYEQISPNIKDDAQEGFLVQGSPQILVAGCGTGREALELAGAYPGSNVLAIDLSLSSLAYARFKARSFEIKNVSFAQADILELAQIDKKFDFIASSGVLHHMSDPKAGLCILKDLLKDEGAMRLGLYSKIARREIYQARQLIQEHKIGNSAQDIRAFRAKAPQLLDTQTYENICAFRDYYSTSECRDLLFHVQETSYELSEIKELLQKAHLRFNGFYLPQKISADFKAHFPGTNSELDLENWAEYEIQNPQSFAAMYRFWCKKDNAG
jgi:ubiquinone/menaquinone biosynthesis C-methylase UbiE